MKRKKIKVLVVDDSLMFRETLAMGIAMDKSMEVVGTAADPYEARDKILALNPDVMTLDVEMPRMNGIEFLKKLMLQHPMPVVVVSAVDGAVFDALNAGAVDFVAKPSAQTSRGVAPFVQDLVDKIKIASRAQLELTKKGVPLRRAVIGTRVKTNYQVIALGASTGGTEAIFSILKKLPRDIPGIVAVQHMPPVFTKLYAERLNNSCSVKVKEAQNRDKVLPGQVLIAPGDFHMRLKKRGEGFEVECFLGEKVNGHRPSVDILFESVARSVGKNAIGVILTGMGADGAKGLLAMRNSGARTVGQDEKSSVIFGMPKVAYEIGAVEYKTHLEDIPRLLYSWTVGS